MGVNWERSRDEVGMSWNLGGRDSGWAKNLVYVGEKGFEKGRVKRKRKMG